MLDPKVAKMVSKELESESIVVFDEAHNIDSVCIEALSVTINDRGLDQASRSLGRLSAEVSKIKATDSQRLQQEYQNLVNGLIEQGVLDAPANDAGLASVSLNGGICSFCASQVNLLVTRTCTLFKPSSGSQFSSALLDRMHSALMCSMKQYQVIFAGQSISLGS